MTHAMHRLTTDQDQLLPQGEFDQSLHHAYGVSAFFRAAG